MPHFGYTLGSLVDHADRAAQVYKAHLRPGDLLVVSTQNSRYFLRVRSDGTCSASGGWFDKKGVAPMIVRIAGCTWGGSTIKIDIAAACGLCLEFGNRVVTSPIQRIVIFPYSMQN